ncbi:hypothetical protein Fmac_029991 [Flemingia macrophylla]|uniref:Uncharacterized protein n=1 Tax=Flemingia macrophylla TaxID=520843 RepID=A0ABD1LBX7_9FABA
MALSHRRTLFTVLQILLFTLVIFVASPESGVSCRPLFLHYQWSWEYGLLMQSLPNGNAPGSGGDNTHP